MCHDLSQKQVVDFTRVFGILNINIFMCFANNLFSVFSIYFFKTEGFEEENHGVYLAKFIGSTVCDFTSGFHRQCTWKFSSTTNFDGYQKLFLQVIYIP